MTKKNSFTIVSLLLIMLFAFTIRMYRISSSPKGALIDEAHFGYLAYSLLETGKDEHGISYPLLFKGFGDQKLPAGAYLMMPVVKFFGLSNATIRYPSILAGTLLILASFWLIVELGFDKKYGLLAAFITAISPWTFFLSRFGFESNLALCAFTFGLASLAKANNEKKYVWFILSGFLLGLPWYAYVAYRPIVVLVALSWLIFLWWLKRNLDLKKLIVFFISFAVTILPLFHPSAQSANTARFSQVGILSDKGVVLQILENRNFCTTEYSKYICYAIWNKPTVIGRMLLERFYHTFSPQFLATEGEGKGKFLTVDEYGQFFHVLYPFFIFGIAVLLIPSKKNTIKNSTKFLIILGLVLAPLPSILVGDPQKVRISPLYPFILISIICGFYGIEKHLKSKILKRLLMVSVVSILIGQTGMYLVDYYSVHAQKKDYSYQSYLPQVMEHLKSYDVTTLINIRPFFSDPLMFYAYYTKMNPQQYQKLAVLGELEDIGFQHTVELGNIWAKDISPESVACEAQKLGKKKAVLVTDQSMTDLPIIKEVKSSNEVHTYVYIYDVTGKCN